MSGKSRSLCSLLRLPPKSLEILPHLEFLASETEAGWGLAPHLERGKAVFPRLALLPCNLPLGIQDLSPQALPPEEALLGCMLTPVGFSQGAYVGAPE